MDPRIVNIFTVYAAANEIGLLRPWEDGTHVLSESTPRSHHAEMVTHPEGKRKCLRRELDVYHVHIDGDYFVVAPDDNEVIEKIVALYAPVIARIQARIDEHHAAQLAREARIKAFEQAMQARADEIRARFLAQ